MGSEAMIHPQPKPEPRKRIKGRKQRAARKILKSVRSRCKDRANGNCERCGKYCPHTGEGHHRIPRSRGGKWTMDNIQWICHTCHVKAHRENDL